MRAAIYRMVKVAYSKMNEQEGKIFYDALSGSYQLLANSVAEKLVVAAITDQIDINQIWSIAENTLVSPTKSKKKDPLERKKLNRLNVPESVLKKFVGALHEGLMSLKIVFRKDPFLQPLRQKIQTAMVSSQFCQNSIIIISRQLPEVGARALGSHLSTNNNSLTTFQF